GLRVQVPSVTMRVGLDREERRDRDVEVNLLPVHPLHRFREMEVGQDEHGSLKALGEVERRNREVVRFDRVRRSEYRPGPLSLTCAEQEVEVALLGLGGEACRQ